MIFFLSTETVYINKIFGILKHIIESEGYFSFFFPFQSSLAEQYLVDTRHSDGNVTEREMTYRRYDGGGHPSNGSQTHDSKCRQNQVEWCPTSSKQTFDQVMTMYKCFNK